METGAKNHLTPPAELLGRALAYARVHGRRLVPVVAIYAFGGLAFQLLAESSFRLTSAYLGLAVFMLAGVFLYVWGSAALLMALKHERYGWQAAYQAALPVVVPYAAVGLAYSALVLLGLILFVVPGVVLAVQLSFAGYVLIFENTGVRGALRQSRDYVRGHFWAVLLRHAAIGLAAMGAYLFLLLIFGILLIPGVTKQLLLTAATSVIVPITSAYVLLMYRELKEIWRK